MTEREEMIARLKRNGITLIGDLGEGETPAPWQIEPATKVRIEGGMRDRWYINSMQLQLADGTIIDIIDDNGLVVYLSPETRASEEDARQHLMTCGRKPGERVRCVRCKGLFHATDSLVQEAGGGPTHGNLDRCREEMGPVEWERYTVANRGTGGPGDIEREEGERP